MRLNIGTLTDAFPIQGIFVVFLSSVDLLINLLMGTMTEILNTPITPFAFFFCVNTLMSAKLRAITFTFPKLTTCMRFCFKVQFLMKLKSGAKAEAVSSFGRDVLF